MLTKTRSTIKPSIFTEVNSAHPLARSLVGCWLLNEGVGRIAYDASGHHHHGSLSGNPTWSTGLLGRAIGLDGTDDWISMGDCLDLGIDDISVLAIVKYSVSSQPDEWSGTRAGAVVGKGHLDGAGRGYGLVINTTNQIHWQVRNQATSFSAVSNTALNDDRWHLVIGICDRDDPTGVKLYIDGILQNVTANATTLNGLALNGSRAFAIGSRQDEATGAWFWDFAGSVAMVCVWKRTLEDAEIRGLQQNPFEMFTRWRSALMRSLPEDVVLPFTASIHTITSAIGVMRVVAGAAGTMVASSATNGALSIAGCTSLLGAVSGCSSLGGDLCIVASQTVFKAVLQMGMSWAREALFNGASHSAFQLGTSLTQGWFWVRRAGCTAVYRGQGVTQVDLSTILYATGLATRHIPLPVHLSHPAGSTHCYLVRRFNGCGGQEGTVAAAVMLRTAVNGQMVQARPNAIVALGSQQRDATGMYLNWFYCPLDQQVMPACFNLYRNGAIDEMDFRTPVGNITYQGPRIYCWHIAAPTDDQYIFAVRAVGRHGTESMRSRGRVLQLATSSPEPAAILSAKPV